MSVTIDIPVVTYPTPPLGLVPAVDVLDADTLTQFGGGAMHYQVLHFLEFAHTRLMQLCIKKVDTMAVMIVTIRLPIFSADGLFNNFIMF